jgi:hypothetical protein
MKSTLSLFLTSALLFAAGAALAQSAPSEVSAMAPSDAPAESQDQAQPAQTQQPVAKRRTKKINENTCTQDWYDTCVRNAASSDCGNLMYGAESVTSCGVVAIRQASCEQHKTQCSEHGFPF